MTSYSDGNKTPNLSQGTNVKFSTGKTNRTSMQALDVGYKAGKDTGKATNRSGDPEGAKNKD